MKIFMLMMIMIVSGVTIYSQGIGELAPEKEPEVFPDNAFGVDIMFGEGGFGLGTFYRRQLDENFTAFTDFSISEAKDEREFEYIDFFGNTFTVGKKNRVFLFPLNFGLQYRLFRESISDNLRPYINAGIGPTLVLTTPYSKEFFDAFGDAHANYAVGGYVGFGANFGLDKSSLIGLNFRYYNIHFFDEGVESLEGRFKKDIGSFFLTINFGFMY
ncbi:MAG: hypothetical protein Kow0098_15850 [Ignavibacteriaceae bacterium]